MLKVLPEYKPTLTEKRYIVKGNNSMKTKYLSWRPSYVSKSFSRPVVVHVIEQFFPNLKFCILQARLHTFQRKKKRQNIIAMFSLIHIKAISFPRPNPLLSFDGSTVLLKLKGKDVALDPETPGFPCRNIHPTYEVAPVTPLPTVPTRTTHII